MALIIIMLFTTLSMWGALTLSFGTASAENGKYLLGITLPRDFREEPEVRAVLVNYKNSFRRLTWWGFVSCFLVIPLNGYVSFLILFIMAWFGVLYHLYSENIRRSARTLYAIKRKNGWLTGSPHIIRIDTVLSSIGDKGAVSGWWFAGAWIIGAAGLYLMRNSQDGWGYIITGINLLVMAAFTLSYFGIRRSKLQVYCSDSEANRKINNSVRREWSWCMAVHSYGVSLVTVCIALRGKGYLPAAAQDAGNLLGIVLFLFLGGMGSMAVIYAAHYKVKKVKERIFECLSDNGAEVYGDDDEYWLNGTPGRKSSGKLVEKRIGIGMTTSTSLNSTTVEKAVWAMTFLFTAGIAAFMMPFDFARITMTVDGETCRVQAASMGYTIPLDRVQEVTLMEERPEMSKKNGYDSNRFYLGDFRVEGYGKCKVYISLDNHSVIKVDTPDEIIWFNAGSQTQTQQFYEQLKSAVEEW